MSADCVALAQAAMDLCYLDSTENRQRAYELASRVLAGKSEGHKRYPNECWPDHSDGTPT